MCSEVFVYGNSAWYFQFLCTCGKSVQRKGCRINTDEHGDVGLVFTWCFFQFPALTAHVCVNDVRFDVRFALNHFPEEKPTKCMEYHNTVDKRCAQLLHGANWPTQASRAQCWRAKGWSRCWEEMSAGMCRLLTCMQGALNMQDINFLNCSTRNIMARGLLLAWHQLAYTAEDNREAIDWDVGGMLASRRSSSNSWTPARHAESVPTPFVSVLWTLKLW